MDNTPLEEHDYYKKSKTIVQSVDLNNKDTTHVLAGWSKSNITPDFPVKVIGFGKRELSDGVIDSIFVRSIVFKQGKKKYLYLSYDLMIVHPVLVKHLEEELSKNKLEFDGIYYSATHTHNSIGGYADKASGWLALGGKDEKVLNHLSTQTINSIKKSESKLDSVWYAYNETSFDHGVKNRVDKQNGKVDDKLRCLQIKNTKQEIVAIITYSAHATCLPRKLNKISRDYPGSLVDYIEQNKRIDFAIFSAGAVGSHEPTLSVFNPKTSFIYARDLAYKVTPFFGWKREFYPLKNIAFQSINLPLLDPHLKIVKGLRLRPWLFDKIMGTGKGKLSFLKLDSVVFTGTPCDFSGEITLEIEKNLTKGNIHPIITSFNGEYLGYIIPDKYYNWDMHEARDVSWFGPHNGQYFQESITEILEKIE